MEDQAKKLAALKGEVQTVRGMEPANDGKLVHFSGALRTRLSDPSDEITDPGG